MILEPYSNTSGDSGVTGYSIGEDAIIVEFRGRECYLYSYASTGSDDVERMKGLAIRGRGLATFISQEVRYRYERKL